MASFGDSAEHPRKFARRPGRPQGDPVDERALGRVWVMRPGTSVGLVVNVPPSRDVDRRLAIRNTVFGTTLGTLVGHAPLNPASDKCWILVDEGAAFTPLCEFNTVATRFVRVLGVFGDDVRGALIVAGPGGTGLTTDQIETLNAFGSAERSELSQAELNKFV